MVPVMVPEFQKEADELDVSPYLLRFNQLSMRLYLRRHKFPNPSHIIIGHQANLFLPWRHRRYKNHNLLFIMPTTALHVPQDTNNQ